VETDGAHAPDQRFTLSLSRRTPSCKAHHRRTHHRETHHRETHHRETHHRETFLRKTPKITLAAAGSALALAAIAAGAMSAWPGHTPAASASLAGAASLTRPRDVAATDRVMAASVHQLKVSGAAARQAAQRQVIARERARSAARAKAAAARAAAARVAAARRRQAPATPAAQAQPATATGSPQQIAQGLLGSYGWPASQFSCLQPLWNAESGWNASASNPSSGAYGIPQALPGSKMASAGPDWQTSAATQIRWGLGYIRSVYGSPCAAWSHEQADGWY
jgi:hypothetical protein